MPIIIPRVRRIVVVHYCMIICREISFYCWLAGEKNENIAIDVVAMRF